MKILRKEILSRHLRQWVENMGFDYEQQCNNTQETARVRQIKLVDESIDSLKLSTLLGQVKYILILMVTVGKQLD